MNTLVKIIVSVIAFVIFIILGNWVFGTLLGIGMANTLSVLVALVLAVSVYYGLGTYKRI